jgi:hypothetical protein
LREPLKFAAFRHTAISGLAAGRFFLFRHCFALTLNSLTGIRLRKLPVRSHDFGACIFLGHATTYASSYTPEIPINMRDSLIQRIHEAFA